MKIEIGIIKALQGLSNVVFDNLFKVITFFGDQIFFILIGVLIFWLYNKKYAFKLVLAFLASSVLVGVLKVFAKRPRPYEYTAEGLRSIGSKTNGYSFPSGHSQGSGLMFFGLKDTFGKKKGIFYALLALLILVPFSRMYLGQHFLTDVLVGTLIGALGIYLMFKVVDWMGDKEHLYALYVIPLAIIGLIVLVVLQGKAANQLEFYDKYQDLFKMVGAYIGFAGSYAVEKMFVKHDVEASNKDKILKTLIGLIPLAILYFGLKLVLPKTGLSDALRYFVVATWAVLGAPFVFTKVFKKQEELATNE